MSKVTDKLLNFMKLNDEDEYDEEFFDETEEEDAEEEEYEQEEEVRKKTNIFGKRTVEENNMEEEEEEPAIPIKETIRKNNITSYRTSREVASSDRGEMVKVIRAQEFEEVRAMIDLLKEDKIVVVNLEGIHVDVAQRIIDCISGASYGLDGKLEGVNDNIFILAPRDVEITGDLKNKIANGSIAPKLNKY